MQQEKHKENGHAQQAEGRSSEESQGNENIPGELGVLKTGRFITDAKKYLFEGN